MWDQISSAQEAAQDLQVWDCYQRPFKIVARHSSFALCCATEDVAFVIRRHPPRSASFACIGSHPSLANQMDVTVTVKVGVARSKTVLPGCAIHWAHVRPDLWKKAGTATITSLGRLPATKRLCSAKQWIHFRLGPHLPCTSSFAGLGSHPSLGGHCWIGSHQVGVGFGSLRFSDCWFDISWPLASFSRSTTALILQS